MKKINFGCGREYLEGYINIDIDSSLRTDLLIKPNQTSLPFEDESIDYIYSKYCLEHLDKDTVAKLICEFYRILVPGGKLELYLPHFSGIAIKHLAHKTTFGVGSFDGFNIKHQDLTMNNLQYPKFQITKEELHVIPTAPTEFSFSKLALLTKPIDYFF